MRQATARERDEVRLPVAPVGESGRPFLRAPELGRVPAGEDDAAVDDPRDDRGQLAGRDRHHRLVEQPEPVLAAAESDQDMSLLVRREGEQVCVAVLAADRRRLGSGRRGGFEVTARLLLEDDGQEEISALHPIDAALLEQPLRAAEPAARASDVSAPREADAQPECAAKGLQALAGGEVRAIAPARAGRDTRTRGRSCRPRSPVARRPGLRAPRADRQHSTARTPPAMPRSRTPDVPGRPRPSQSLRAIIPPAVAAATSIDDRFASRRPTRDNPSNPQAGRHDAGIRRPSAARRSRSRALPAPAAGLCPRRRRSRVSVRLCERPPALPQAVARRPDRARCGHPGGR